jgi:hypothetical protein
MKKVADTPQNWKLIEETPKNITWKRKQDKGSVAMRNTFWHGWVVKIDDPKTKVRPDKIECGRSKPGKKLAKTCAEKYMKMHP